MRELWCHQHLGESLLRELWPSIGRRGEGMMLRRGNAAALFILLLLSIIIAYLLALNPAYREEILSSVMFR